MATFKVADAAGNLVDLASTTTTDTLSTRSDTLDTEMAAIYKSGYLLIDDHSAPSDGSLTAGQAVLWFDQTNGAGKLKIKGKTANGTVVAGEVALT